MSNSNLAERLIRVGLDQDDKAINDNLINVVQMAKVTLGRLIGAAESNRGGLLYKQIDVTLKGIPTQPTLDPNQKNRFCGHIHKYVTMAEEASEAAKESEEENS